MLRSGTIQPVTGELSHIDAMNSRFGIPGVARVASGNGGLPKINIATISGSAEIYLYGAQVTSWRPAGAEEVIFLSKHSHWETGSAIRGGIPVCFPWFRAKADNPQAPAHGFARIREWQLDSISAKEDGAVIVICSTESDALTCRRWPYEFRLEYRIIVSSTLRVELNAHNIGTTPLRFEEALHTYFRVGQVQSVRVRGLDEVAYLDNTEGNREEIQSGDLVINATTDNAYLNTHGSPELIDPILRRIIRTDKENSATTVVWNPWQQGATALSDLGDDEWQRMVCVEASNILGSAVSLAPGQEHTMCATLSIT